jgi:hypothetical protein
LRYHISLQNLAEYHDDIGIDPSAVVLELVDDGRLASFSRAVMELAPQDRCDRAKVYAAAARFELPLD